MFLGKNIQHEQLNCTLGQIFYLQNSKIVQNSTSFYKPFVIPIYLFISTNLDQEAVLVKYSNLKWKGEQELNEREKLISRQNLSKTIFHSSCKKLLFFPHSSLPPSFQYCNDDV